MFSVHKSLLLLLLLLQLCLKRTSLPPSSDKHYLFFTLILYFLFCMNSPIPLKFPLVHILFLALFSFLSKILEILTSHPACSSSAVPLGTSQPQSSCTLPGTPQWSMPCPSCRKTCTAHHSQVRSPRTEVVLSGRRYTIQKAFLFPLCIHSLGIFICRVHCQNIFKYIITFNLHTYPRRKGASTSLYKKQAQ